MSTVDDIVAFKDEVMLAGWSDSHNGSPKVVFFLRDSKSLEAFRHLTVAKGKTAGHRFVMVLVELGDDEMPINQSDKKGGALTKLAAMFCTQERFWQWARLSDENGWARAEAMAMTSKPVEVAAEWIRLVCGVQSRRELDSNPAATKLFHEKIRIPYSKSLDAVPF
jgi:hypothetical protein